MGEVTVRRLAPGEEERFVRSVRIPFLDPYTGDGDQPAWLERVLRRMEYDRSWVAEEDGRFVANCGIRTMDVTVPGPEDGPCAVVPMGGVTAVGVHPTHRRRGILGRMMAAMLDDCRRRGEPLAGLIASESVIYGRFGFGLASDWATFEIDTREARMLVAPPPARLDLLERDEAAKVLPGLFEHQRLGRPGEVSRGDGFWEEFFVDAPQRDRHPARALYFAVGDEGYVAYRADEGGSTSDRERIVIEELRATSPDAEAALWSFVFGIDLTDRVVARRRPVDEPLRWRLADPRQLRQTAVDDRLYLRILDLPAAVAARAWRGEGRLVLDVSAPPSGADPADPVPGRWVLEAGPGGGSCRPAGPGEPPDVTLDVTALGSLYLGGYPASLLAAGGRVAGLTPGSLAVADRLFATWPAPLTGTGF